MAVRGFARLHVKWHDHRGEPYHDGTRGATVPVDSLDRQAECQSFPHYVSAVNGQPRQDSANEYQDCHPSAPPPSTHLPSVRAGWMKGGDVADASLYLLGRVMVPLLASASVQTGREKKSRRRLFLVCVNVSCCLLLFLLLLYFL